MSTRSWNLPGEQEESDLKKSEPDSQLQEDDVNKTARRREQIRRAQRTHRDRRATYLKTLESEVAKLRARDCSHDAEIASYRETIRRLKGLIRQYNIPLTPDLASDPLIYSPQVAVTLQDLPDLSQALQARFPDGYFLNPADISTPPVLSNPSGSSSSTDLLAGLAISDAPRFVAGTTFQSSMSASMPIHHPQGLGNTQVGVDFVLALESVCLAHHAKHSGDSDGSGHETMLSSPIMSRCPPLNPAVRPGSGLLGGSTWNVPAAELEKLLEFSDRLRLHGEITPVEGWQRIRQHPKFSILTLSGLEILKNGLLPEVTCYGFGAVIDEDVFESHLAQALGSLSGQSSR